jgi:predicted small secreted protein
MLLMFVTLTAAACNTTEGFGKDVEAAGDAIEDKAQDADDDER